MRRLWAYISLAFTALVTVGATFPSVATKIKSNIEYENGREITFRVSEKKDDDKPKEVTLEGTKEIAQTMVDRLKTSKVTAYQVDVVGEDTIKVFASQDSDSDYDFLSTYLSFNGNLALSYGNSFITADEFLAGKKAIIKTYNTYPCILLPVKTDSEDFKSLINEARQDKADEKRDFAEETTTQNEEGEDVSSYKYFLYLWYDFVEGKCTFEASQDTSDEYNERVLMKFQVTSTTDGSDENPDVPQFFPDKDKNKLYSAINLDLNQDGIYEISEREMAYKRAEYFINLINASELEYDVTSIFSEAVTTPTWIESLVSYSSDGNHLVVAWSSTFAATITAILILAALLVVYYRINAVAISTLSVASVYVAFLSIILFNAEFNTFGIIALGIVALASIVSGVVYAHKLKEECYRGRSLKKANSEASKKSLLPIIDVNVVVIIIGVFCYIFGGAIMRNFAVITVFGGIASLILNTLGLKGMMWLSTNTTSLQGKYEVFGVKSENVPNLINEEKQTYFGAYADTDFTAKKKPVGIIAGIVVLASAIGLSVFGGLAAAGKTTVYGKSATAETTSIYFESKEENSDLREEGKIKEILSNLKVYLEDDPDTKVSLFDEFVSTSKDGFDFNSYTRSEKEDGVEVNYYYVVVDFNKAVPSDMKVCLWTGNDGTKDIYEMPTETYGFQEAVNELLDSYNVEGKTSISCKVESLYKRSEYDFGPVALGCLVATAVIGAYLMLRYRLSRGLTAIIAALSTGVFSIGFLTLLRFIAIPSMVVAALPFVVAFTLMISIFFMNREREMIVEDKTHDNSLENRNAIMKKATSSTFGVILPVTIFAMYYGINFFGFGPVSTAWTYLVIILGVVFAALIVTTLYGPISQFFFKLFKGDAVRESKKVKKVKTVKVNRSAEPEEATFIGIND